MSDWKTFEMLVTRIQQQMAQNASVRHDEKLVGKSGVTRQLDVTVRQTVGPVEVLVVFECKHHKRATTIDQIESFAKKLEDVGASEGVVVSTSGFTHGAKEVARELGITLLSYRQASEADWAEVLGTKAWIELISTTIESYKVTAYSPDLGDVELDLTTPLYDSQKQESQTLQALAEEALQWDDSPRPGRVLIEAELRPLRHIRRAGRTIPIKSIRVDAEKVARSVPVNLELATGDILHDAVEEEERFAQLSSKGFDWRAKLQSSPGKRITPEEYDELDARKFMNPAILDPDRTKRFLRIVATKKTGSTRSE